VFCDRSWWWIPFILFMGCGAGLGFWFGFTTAEEFNRDTLMRSELTDKCLGGNDRACRLYEVKYGR